METMKQIENTTPYGKYGVYLDHLIDFQINVYSRCKDMLLF